MSEVEGRPLWRWVLMGLAPGLLSDALSAVAALTSESNDAALSDLGGIALIATLFMPPLMLVYLIILSGPYARSGKSPFRSRLGFVFAYSILNLFLWGAGCTLILADLQLH